MATKRTKTSSRKKATKPARAKTIKDFETPLVEAHTKKAKKVLADKPVQEPVPTRRGAPYKLLDGWYFTVDGEKHGPFRSREVARETKRLLVQAQDKKVLDVLEKAVEKIESGDDWKEPTPEQVEAIKEQEVAENIVEALPTKQIVYKVVSTESDGNGGTRYFSARVSRSSRMCLEYFTDKVTSVEPELFEAGFGICCFPTLEAAKSWGGWNACIFKCEATETRMPASRRPSRFSLSSILPVDGSMPGRQILAILTSHLEKDCWPYGCIVASDIRLLEKVENVSRY